ncbi:MAG: hypothetical protein QM724_10980 [Flavobacteriales bacterium]
MRTSLLVFLFALCGSFCMAGSPQGFGLLGHRKPPVPGTPLRLRGSWAENKHATHTLFGPSALPLKPGQGYYQNNYIVMHSAWFAPVEHVTIGAGFQMLSVIASLSGTGRLPAYFAAIKAGTEIGGVHAGIFAAGAQLSNGALVQDTASLRGRIGLAAGQVTVGTPDAHVTVTLGWGATREGLTDDPVVGISGQVRVIERMALVSENWSFQFGGQPFRVYTLAARFLTNNLGADGGLLYSAQFAKDVSPVLPYIGFALRF